MKFLRPYLRAALLAVACFAGHPVHALTCTIDDAQLRALVAAEVAAAIKGQPGTTPAPTPGPDAKPVPGGRPIPFAEYIARGITGNEGLLWIQTQATLNGRQIGALTPEEFEAAYQAGYPRPNPLDRPSGGSAGDLSGFDLTGTAGGGLKRNVLERGGLYLFSFTAARSAHAHWHFEVNPTPGPESERATTVSIDGAPPEELRESRRINFNAVAGQTYRVTLLLNGRATIGTVVRYDE